MVERIRVVHCDDYRPFVDLVGFWLAEQPDVEHLGAAQDREGALALVARTQPDVVLLDTMAGGANRVLIGELRALAPGAQVIVYSGHPPAVAREMVDEAADAYLEKTDDEAELLATIRRVVGPSGSP